MAITWEIDKPLAEKLEALQAVLRDAGKVAVAFSGGVDSAFLLRAARDALGSRCAAFTASSCIFPARELGEAKDFCARSGIRQEIIPFDALSVEGFRQNPPARQHPASAQHDSTGAE